MSELKDYVSQSEEMGSINISEDVVASIAALSITDIEGVSGLAANIGSDIAELLGRKNLSRGIKLQISGNEVIIDAHLLIKYGYTIPQIAKEIQDKVTNAVESMTGLKVTAVNIHVGGITFDKADKSAKKDKNAKG